jgi:hypothetical protein
MRARAASARARRARQKKIHPPSKDIHQASRGGLVEFFSARRERATRARLPPRLRLHKSDHIYSPNLTAFCLK